MQKDPLFRTTLITIAALVGACMLFVGSLSIVAVLVTSHVVGNDGHGDKDAAPAQLPKTAKSLRDS